MTRAEEYDSVVHSDTLDDPKRRPTLDREAFLGVTEAFPAERAQFHSSH